MKLEGARAEDGIRQAVSAKLDDACKALGRMKKAADAWAKVGGASWGIMEERR